MIVNAADHLLQQGFALGALAGALPVIAIEGPNDNVDRGYARYLEFPFGGVRF